jgi:hypothetical protein
MRTSAAAHRVLAGSSLTSTFPIASGWFSPASPSRVYERSNPRGPSTFIPSCRLHETRQLTPATVPLDHSAHVRCRPESRCALESHPYFASQSSRPYPLCDQQLFLEQAGQAAQITPIKSLFRRFFPNSLSRSGECHTRFRGEEYLRVITCVTCARELLGGECLGKSKGCDIGYALAGHPREEANSVDTRTVTAL